MKLTTKRLTFRRLNLADDAFIFALYDSPGFKRFVGDKGFTHTQQARRFITDKLIPLYQPPMLGLYCLENQQQQAIGIAGLLKRPQLEQVDLGYGLLPEFEGQGYALEACHGLISLSEHYPQIEHILAICQPGSPKSIRLLGRLGFEFQGEREIEQERLNVYQHMAPATQTRHSA